MKWIFGLMLVISFIAAIFTGNMNELSAAAMNSCVEAVELFLYLIGGMCMWGGVMRIAEKAGITRVISKAFRPLARLLFPGLDLEGKAFGLICMNVAANIMGLGNAATPIGIQAITEIEKEEEADAKIKKLHRDPTVASRNMIVFIVLNTASITLIPQTAAALRLKHGALMPFDIFPCVVITSVCALVFGVTAAFLLNGQTTLSKKINTKRIPQNELH